MNTIKTTFITPPVSFSEGYQVLVTDIGEGAFSLGANFANNNIQIWQNNEQNPQQILGNITFHYIVVCH